MTTERLQAAIEKARRERETKDSNRPAEVTARDVATPSGDVSHRPTAAPGLPWNDLQAVTFDNTVMERNRILSYFGGRQAVTFDMARTRVLQRMKENGWRRIAITSAMSGCGKSTMALNLAFGMSRQADRRVVSIEADMRRPSHDRLLGLSGENKSKRQRREQSVADVLLARREWHEALVRGKDNLAFATTPRPINNASDVMLSSTVGPVLDRLEKDYAPDIVIFDMPPLLISDDAQAFLGHVDCALVVAAAGQTTTNEVDQCERMIAQSTNVMGVVLNKSRFSNEGQYGYY